MARTIALAALAALPVLTPLVARAQPATGAPQETRDPRVIEQELRKIRAQHFRAGPNTERRLEGNRLLEAYTSPKEIELMLEIFESEDHAAQVAIYDHLAELSDGKGGGLGVAALSWEAVHDEDPEDRRAAADRLATLTGHRAPAVTQTIIADGLRSESGVTAGGAAVLADRYGLIEAVPMMISAQTGPPRVTPERTGPLGTFYVAKQQAFVSDLQPVVSDSAVGFDPTISVLTEGVVLSVDRATVVTYRTEVHDALVRLTTRETGQGTDWLGYEPERWSDWYDRNLRTRVEERLASLAQEQDRGDGEAAGVAERDD